MSTSDPVTVQGVLAFQAIPPRPGQEQAPSEPSAPPEEGAPPGMGSSSLFMILMFVPLLLFMFWQSRSQQKKQEAAISALKKGDRVVTQSGLVGRMLEVDNRYAKLELAPGVKVSVLRSSLAGRDAEDSAKSSGAKSEAKSETKAKDPKGSKGTSGSDSESKSDK